MKDFYIFAGNHPFLTFCLAYLAMQVVCWPFSLVNRWIRSRNIKNAGWPPAHLDADGDVHNPSLTRKIGRPGPVKEEK